jgi:hypothetical protein
MVTQLRTGKIGLRQFLHSRKVPDIGNAMCECGQGNQTVKHVLLACRRLEDLRKKYLTDKCGKHTPPTDIKTVLTTPALARKAVQYMVASKLLRQYWSYLQHSADIEKH